MQPTQNDVHVNALMSQFSLMFAQDQDTFVADRMFPTIPVLKASDRYLVYSRADFNRNTMRIRANSTESAGGGYKIDNTPTYVVDDWGLHKDIDDRVRQNADSIMNLDLEATKWLTTQYLISKEINWANTFFKAGVWGTNWTGVSTTPVAGTSVLQWNDPASQPITDLRSLKRTVQLASGGFRPNKAAIGRYVLDTLIDHPDFVDRIKYGGTNDTPAKVALKAIASVLELDEVMVVDAIVNNGVEGAPEAGINANESNAFIVGKGILLAYVPPSPGVMTPASGYGFSWTGQFGNNVMGSRLLSYYMQNIRSTRVEIEAAYVYKLVASETGAFIDTVVA